MEGTATPRGRGRFLRSKRKARPNYKQRIARQEAQRAPAADASPTGATFAPVEQVRVLAGQAEVERTAFQSVAVAALQTLRRVGYYEHRAAEATISLAQRQKLQHMIDELEATRRALGTMLSPHGAAMLSRNTPPLAGEAPESSWWFALCEALHALEEGVSGLDSITAGQPRNSATRRLSGIVVRLLEQHYHALFAEAEQWLG